MPGIVYWSYLILPFGIVACTFLPTTSLEIAVNVWLGSLLCKWVLLDCYCHWNICTKSHWCGTCPPLTPSFPPRRQKSNTTKSGPVVGALAPTNVTQVQILALTPYVGWVCCWFSPLIWKVFLRVLRFSPLHKNQLFQIPIRSGTHGHVSTSYYELLSAPWAKQITNTMTITN